MYVRLSISDQLFTVFPFDVLHFDSCEGRCMRSFHATEASGEGLCDSLGLSAAQVNVGNILLHKVYTLYVLCITICICLDYCFLQAIPNFICKNCQYQQHQCFICGKLGSSDMSSSPEVYPVKNFTRSFCPLFGLLPCLCFSIPFVFFPFYH